MIRYWEQRRDEAQPDSVWRVTWHPVGSSHTTSRSVSRDTRDVTRYHIIPHNLDGTRRLENLNERDDYKYRGGRAGEEWDCIAWLWRVLMCGVWHAVTCDNCHSPGLSSGWHWHVTVTGSGWRGTRDTWHHATLTTWFRSENTLNGNTLRYLNPLTPHWASAPNKTISDVSSGWSYRRLKGDNWDHNPSSALWKPQCLSARTRLIPVLCLSESVRAIGCRNISRARAQSPVPDLALWVTSDGRVTAVKMASQPGYWWRCGIIMVTGSERERSAPCIVTSSHCTLTLTWGTSCYACEGGIKSVTGCVISVWGLHVSTCPLVSGVTMWRDVSPTLAVTMNLGRREKAIPLLLSGQR